jgi:hypothetical protein
MQTALSTRPALSAYYVGLLGLLSKPRTCICIYIAYYMTCYVYYYTYIVSLNCKLTQQRFAIPLGVALMYAVRMCDAGLVHSFPRQATASQPRSHHVTSDGCIYQLFKGRSYKPHSSCTCIALRGYACHVTGSISPRPIQS